jgi:hypothetical protein
MSLTEHQGIAGRLTLRLYSAASGALVEERTAHNDITIHGRQLVARLFNPQNAATPIARISRICVGGGDRAFNAQDNDLAAKIGGTPIRKVEEDTVAGPRRLLRLIGELGEKDCNGELREAGLFTEEEDVMYNRVIFKPINKSAEFKLTLVWEITF